MEKEKINAWAAGLFEGEGSFNFHKDKAKAISITSTDLDVLEKLKLNFGGCIYPIKKRKDHWKDAYIWTLRKQESVDFYNSIKVYLLSRRSKRGEEWIYSINNNKRKLETDIIKSMFLEGKTHKEISEKIGWHRTSVTKFLNRNK